MPASKINIPKLKDVLRTKFVSGQSHHPLAPALLMRWPTTDELTKNAVAWG
jgi:hypothetical protein